MACVRVNNVTKWPFTLLIIALRKEHTHCHTEIWYMGKVRKLVFYAQFWHMNSTKGA